MGLSKLWIGTASTRNLKENQKNSKSSRILPRINLGSTVEVKDLAFSWAISSQGRRYPRPERNTSEAILSESIEVVGRRRTENSTAFASNVPKGSGCEAQEPELRWMDGFFSCRLSFSLGPCYRLTFMELVTRVSTLKLSSISQPNQKRAEFSCIRQNFFQ